MQGFRTTGTDRLNKSMVQQGEEQVRMQDDGNTSFNKVPEGEE
jgi:hypothetical protein